jgi:beta-lactamase superfamily II metal-dependent hydrolase
MDDRIVGDDLLTVYVKENGKKIVLTVLAWGDPIKVGPSTTDGISVTVKARILQQDGSIKHVDRPGFVSKKAKFLNPSNHGVVKFSVVDVQQGDGSVLETPGGQIVLIDGGETQMYARYLAARYPSTSSETPLEIAAIVVTHGDADHFVGLQQIHESETNAKPHKRLFIHPARVYHNGLVKRPSSKKLEEILGATRKKGSELYITGLENDLRQVSDSEMNLPFKRWKAALNHWTNHGPIAIQRLSDKTNGNEFSFLSGDEITVEVLGPIEEKLDGITALPMLRTPSKELPEDEGEPLGANAELSASYSDSHTINGHSVVLRITHGNIRLLLTGDLNAEAEAKLVKRSKAGSISLSADMLKAPHHGSADFSPAFLDEVKPVVSVISSGDENERKEYIHPRATLVGALGRYSRVPRPLIFVTEMVAFFTTRGWAKQVDKKGKPVGNEFFAFDRTSYGIVNFRFDKNRLLVFTHSGKRDLKEAYAFTVSKAGKAKFDAVRMA